MRGYEVYRSDERDITYMTDYFNFDNPEKGEESYSLSLLVSKSPVHKKATETNLDRRNLDDQNYAKKLREYIDN